MSRQQPSARRRWASCAAALVLPLAVGGAGEGVAVAMSAPAWSQQVLFYVLAAATCVVLARGRLRPLGLGRAPGRLLAAGGLAGALRALTWLLVIPTVSVGGPPGDLVVALLLVIAVSVPSEELQFRGLLLGRLRTVTGPATAVALSAAAFAALHAVNGPLLLPAVAADGVLFAVCALRSGSVAPAVLAHAVVDAVTLVRPAAPHVALPVVLSYELCVLLADAALCVAVLRTGRGARRLPAPPLADPLGAGR